MECSHEQTVFLNRERKAIFAERPDTPSFSADRLARLRQIENRHFWFVGRQLLVDRLVARYLAPDISVLDIGCGTGTLVERLRLTGRHVIGLDVPWAPREGEPMTRFSPRVIYGRGEELPLPGASIDAVLLLDVLEHTDDRAVLGEVRRVLRHGGHAIVMVPALPWLWSYRDDAAGHRRRYTLRTLGRLLADVPFRIEQLGYHHALLFPLLAASRLLRRDRSGRDAEDYPPRMVNAILATVERLEARLHRHLHAPIGSSLVAVVRKIA